MELSWKMFIWTGFNFALLVLLVSVTVWIILKLQDIGKPPNFHDEEDLED